VAPKAKVIRGYVDESLDSEPEDPEVQAKLAIASGKAWPVLSYRERLKDALVDGLEGAVFRVKYIDPDCSGMDWRGHLGAIIVRAKRCCKNCTIVWGNTRGHYYEMGPFGENELEPINNEAREIAAEIERYSASHWRQTHPQPTTETP
jgi:hypothetical protein